MREGLNSRRHPGEVGRSVATRRHPPITYGTPTQISVLLESVARLVEGEPTVVFDDPDVRQSAHRLSTLLHHRMTDEDASPEHDG
jgi:hypothetical protein